MYRKTFPFSAVVGQDNLKLALLVNSVDPTIGGVLIKGPKGVAKSTAVRALASVLPEIEIVKGCRFGCDPLDNENMCDDCKVKSGSGRSMDKISRKMRIVELPVSATLDRVVGSLSIRKAIEGGDLELHPGLLAEANRGILYIDEVNLLDDNIIDSILDATASGINIVERESISVIHPSRIILVGTMNPEEGELRPQFLDRFGISVEAELPGNEDELLEIVRRVQEFDSNYAGFTAQFQVEEDELSERIVMARKILPDVSVESQLLRFIAAIVLKYSLSNRSMITTVKVARAIAALSSRNEVSIEDIRTALKFSLRHRLKNQKKQQENVEQEIEDRISSLDRQDDSKLSGEESESPDRGNGNKNSSERKESENLRVNIDAKNEVKLSGKTGTSHSYRRIGQKDGVTFDFYSSMISMAKNGRKRLSFRDIQFRDTVSRGSVPIIIALDTSRSMGVFQRMQTAKNISRSLITSAYISRSRVALITFSGTAGEIATNYTRNLSSIENLIDAVDIRGRTPLPHALMLANGLSSEEFRKNGRGIAMFLTDGRGNVSISGNMKQEIEDFSTELGKTSDVYMVHSSKGSQRFLPTFNDTIARCSGGRVINLAELEHEIRIGI